MQRGVAPIQQQKMLDPNGNVDDDTIVDRTLIPQLKIPTASPTRTRSSQGRTSPLSSLNLDFCGTIQRKDLLERGCPCCKQCIDERQLTLPGSKGGLNKIAPFSKSAFDDESVDSDVEEMLPSGVAEGLHYYPTEILVEGWVHKKGTGQDWLGSTSWKPRWARLVMAKVETYEVDVPLLMIYWYAETYTPSNVIILDSTVTFPIDMEDKERWDAFRFDIRNAKTVATNSSGNRTFCAPKKARDAWIYATSQALLVFEKENAKARKAARRVSPLPQMSHRPTSPPLEEIWSGDRIVSPGKNSPKRNGLSSPPRMASPPTSPTSHNHKSRVARRTAPRAAATYPPEAPSK